MEIINAEQFKANIDIFSHQFVQEAHCIANQHNNLVDMLFFLKLRLCFVQISTLILLNPNIEFKFF